MNAGGSPGDSADVRFGVKAPSALFPIGLVVGLVVVARAVADETTTSEVIRKRSDGSSKWDELAPGVRALNMD